MEMRPVGRPTFAGAKPRLEQQLRQETAQQFVQRLAASSRVEVFLAPPPGEPVASALR
ncbi:hypothetical protein [Methylacidimicrobium tartarophylax]|uniref:Uncharacterized protein n=1 Tax=Methylacidimicrobium tartarophylax TaxID=1041768 RepID=A0A5E6MGQ9_9BACT|nr:hypothetical protein [Methylacidimicrobium tartarophylax]VVM04664.1 hypothetical protein MAMT_00216 [Methylacidimicrobium tartarophylax]